VFVNSDDTVRPLLDGSGFRAPSADPAIVLTHAVGGNRTRLVLPDSGVTVTGTGGRLCQQVPTDPANGCLTGGFSDSAHWVQFGPVRPEAGRSAVALLWSQPGNRITIRPTSSASLTTATSLALRVIAQTNITGNTVEVAIRDNFGRRATLGQFTLDGLPKPTFTTANWAQEVRMSLSGAGGINLNAITALELVPRSASGQIVLLDAWGWRSGTPGPQPATLPRVDLGELTVDEGNSGSVTYRVPAVVTGTVSGTARVRVFVVSPSTGLATDQLVTLPAGATTIDIPITVTGDTVANGDRTFIVAVKAVSGTEVGDAYGALNVNDEES
jgi:hypothetical protein